MKISLIEGPEGLVTGGSDWHRLAGAIAKAKPDVLVTNEMPFGRWLSQSPSFDRRDAEAFVLAHETGLEALADLSVPTILSSRPVPFGDKLANEAFLLADGIAHARASQAIPSR